MTRMVEIPFDNLEEALSLERFGRYLDWAGRDRGKAIDLYTKNTLISESLYTPLQMLEVALRNRVHAVMGDKHGPDWIVQEALLLGDHQPRQVTAAVKGLEDDGKDATPSRIVAALTLGFWTAMVGKVYENTWQQGLHRIARREDGKGLRRKDLAAPLMRIRHLRNRIAHHEPIIYSDLHKTHEQTLQLIRWLSPPAAEWCRTHSRFPVVCPPCLHLEIKGASRRRPE